MLPDAVRCVRDEIWSSVEGDYTWHQAPSRGLTKKVGGGGTLIILKLYDMQRNVHRAECTDTSAA
jgi:hypothetical protein